VSDGVRTYNDVRHCSGTAIVYAGDEIEVFVKASSLAGAQGIVANSHCTIFTV
jgi:hypothetical protein